MTKTPKRPRDPNQLAKLVIDIASGNVQDAPQAADTNPMAALGRAGGLMGGNARAAALSPEQRSLIAANAAKTRWRKRDDGDGR